MGREKSLKCVSRDFQLLRKALEESKEKVPTLVQLELVEGSDNSGEKSENSSDSNSLFHWQLVVIPPDGSIYGGPHPRKPTEVIAYVMQWNFNEEHHPHEPPQIVFRTPIFHPLIDESDGKLCDGVLNADDWKPTTSPIDILNKVVQKVFVEYCGTAGEMPFNAAAAKLLSGGEESKEFAAEVAKRKALIQ